MKYITIKSAKYISEYKIRFKFSNKVSKDVDFSPFILNNGDYYSAKFRNIKEFKKFKIEDDCIRWEKEGDKYFMAFEIDTLLKKSQIKPISLHDKMRIIKMCVSKDKISSAIAKVKKEYKDLEVA